MLKTKKILAFLLASAMMCAAFTACDESESGSESSSKAESSAEESSEEESSEEESAAEESSAPQQVQTGDFEEAVVPQSGDAYLSMADGQWWLQYTGSDADYLTYDAGVVPITGNGDYTVSVTVDTNSIRYDATGDVNGELIANGTAFMAVQIMDGADATPNAVIDVTAVKVDGTEIPLTKKSFTNTEETEIDGTKHNNIRSNIFNEWVPDDSLPGDARSAEGNIADLANKADYSATILDPSAIGDWTTIEVNFTVSGM
ncbi:hypothetical protein [Ruminococcus sp.]|uniref:hypothetical protein n=1 Tax=Ruminococcus sp. TaxID=41978 RepID=UPI0025E55849|nr:hypothetical protein [Ruminococcus sp.]